MAFPASPTAGQLWTSPNGTRYKYTADGAWQVDVASINVSGSTATPSPTAPVSPTVGALWFDTTNNILMIYTGPTNGWLPTTLNAITTSITKTVPGDFPTINAAIDYFSAFTIAESGLVTIQVAAGTHTITEPLRGHPQGSRLVIKGAGITGSAPIYADFSAVTGPQVGNPAVLAMLQGKYQTIINCSNTHGVRPYPGQEIQLEDLLFVQTAGTIYTGAVIYGSGLYLKNVSFHGFKIYGINVRRGTVTQYGNVTVSGIGTSAANDGIYISEQSSWSASGIVPNTVVAACYGSGIECIQNSVFFCEGQDGASVLGKTVQSLGNNIGFSAEANSVMYISESLARYNAVQGYSSYRNSLINAGSSSSYNNGSSGYLAASQASIDATNARSQSNSRYGFEAQVGSLIYSSTGTIASANTDGGYYAAIQSTIYVPNGGGSNPGTQGVHHRATLMSFILFNGAVDSSSSPAANTVGNQNSYAVG